MGHLERKESSMIISLSVNWALQSSCCFLIQRDERHVVFLWRKTLSTGTSEIFALHFNFQFFFFLSRKIELLSRECTKSFYQVMSWGKHKILSYLKRRKTKHWKVSSSFFPYLHPLCPPSFILFLPSSGLPLSSISLMPFLKFHHLQSTASSFWSVCLISYDVQITKSSWRPDSHTAMHSIQSSRPSALYTLTILPLLFIISSSIQITECKLKLRNTETKCLGWATKAAQQEISVTENLQNSHFQRWYWEQDQEQNLSSYLKSQEICIYV